MVVWKVLVYVSKHFTSLPDVADKVDDQAKSDHVETLLCVGGNRKFKEAVLLNIVTLRMQIDVGSIDPTIFFIGSSGDSANIKHPELGQIAIVLIDGSESFHAPLAGGRLTGFGRSSQGPRLVLREAAERVESGLDLVLVGSGLSLLKLLEKSMELGDLLGMLGRGNRGSVGVGKVFAVRSSIAFRLSRILDGRLLNLG